MVLPTAETPIAKSLHTLTVLQQIAHLHARLEGLNDPTAAMDAAMVTLGLAGRPDPYSLRALALQRMSADPAAHAGWRDTGRRAFAAGAALTDCPVDGARAEAWREGWQAGAAHKDA